MVTGGRRITRMTLMAGTPQTVAARRAVIAEIISTVSVESQHQLLDLISARGFTVTQATLSRDLDAIDATKGLCADGTPGYVLANDSNTSLPIPGADIALARAVSDLLLSAESSGVMVVLRTPPGAAQFLAGHIDRGRLFDTLGTVAGDDTIFIVARSTSLAGQMCSELLRLAESGSTTHG